MKGDFTRDTFDIANRFSQVLMQQGRVTLDADFNEQGSILLHYLRTLARDLIGPYAAPVENPGFRLRPQDDGLRITDGRIYVDGILVENDEQCDYLDQPYYHPPDDDPVVLAADGQRHPFFAYLDVWERYVSAVENDGLREVALGGPDTCGRAQVVWQVRAMPLSILEDRIRRTNERDQAEIRKLEELAKLDPTKENILRARAKSILKRFRRGRGFLEDKTCDGALNGLMNVSDALLAARVDPGQRFDDACVTPPDSKYRGVENQLYRVEIHREGDASVATFKWSRDNGSVMTTWLAGSDLQVANSRGFSAGNWVELTDAAREFAGRPVDLVKVVKVEDNTLTVEGQLPDYSTFEKPTVRRWDQTQSEKTDLVGGCLQVKETPRDADPDRWQWIDLEDGIQIRFDEGGSYRTGDYWLIPARVIGGQLEWPSEELAHGTVEKLLPPRGIVHHYAPLGFVDWDGSNPKFTPCNCEFDPLSNCFNRGSMAFGPENLIKRTLREPVSPSPAAPDAKAIPASRTRRAAPKKKRTTSK